MKEHELKTWPEYFIPISRGLKNFEIRYNDRNFQVGDILILQEYEPDSEEYTGREITAFVTFMMKADKPRGGANPSSGINDGYVIMSIDVRRMDL